MTMRSVAIVPDISQKDWVLAVNPVDQMKMGMKSTVMMARIRRLAKIGERALRPRLICIMLHRFLVASFKIGLCFERSRYELVSCLADERHRV